jgi:NitT/TauT family transport system substrate-binding protein
MVSGLVFFPALGRDGRPLKPVRFMLQWFPQAEFAGPYLALDKGIYKKYGIDLTIVPGGANLSSVDGLASGRVDFAEMWLSTAIQQRAHGLRLVNVAQVIQRSALMFVAKKSSGIATPRDMEGKKVGLWRGDFQLQPLAFIKKYNLKVKTVVQPFSTDYIDMFLLGAMDVATAMVYNEYHLILNSGLNPDELTTFFFRDHGLNFPENGLYALQETYDRDPGLCRDFARATMEGWDYCLSHPSEALEVVLQRMREAHVPAGRAHQKWMLDRMIELIIPLDARQPLGTLRPEDYERVGRALKDNGQVREIPPFGVFSRGGR